MGQFAHTCPFCDVRIGLETVGLKKTVGEIYALYLQCGNCTQPSIAPVAPRNISALDANWNAKGAVVNQFIATVVQTIPDISNSTAPAHIPAEVERVFIQSRTAHRQGHLDLAAMGYRRSVELAFKAADPSIKGQLGPRTDALAARQVLSGPMKDWADNVRLLGNEANHDPPEPTPDAVEDLFLFTETLLEFLYTMPKRVSLRREATEEGKAGIARTGPDAGAPRSLPAPGQ